MLKRRKKDMKKTLSFILLCASMAFAASIPNTNPAQISEVTKVSTPAEFEGYEYGAATVHYKGLFYRFYCSHGLNSDQFIQYPNNYKNGWDYIRMRTSKDGATWSAPRIVLVPSSNVDSCACDPAIIRSDGYWYLYYTGFDQSYRTETFVARSKNIEGPYEERLVGDSSSVKWEKNPKKPSPVFKTKKKTTNSKDELPYGAGQLSVVKTKDGKFHFWFTDVDNTPDNSIRENEKLWKFVHVVASNPYKDLQNKKRTDISIGNQKRFPMNDFGDVKWNPKDTVFEMWMTSKHYSLAHFTEDNKEDKSRKISLKRYTSKDGNTWTFKDSVGAFHFASNVGMSGDSIGHINKDGKYLVTFAANKDSLAFKKNTQKLRACCNKQKNDCSKSESWSGCWFDDGAQVPKDIFELSDVLFDVPYPTYEKIWSNVNNERSGAVPGLPWSTYQFVVGGVPQKKISITYSDSVNNGMKYFQFPLSNLDSKNLEFIAGDYDGDGIIDIGAVDRKTNKWYIRSSKKGSKSVPNISWGWRSPRVKSLDSANTSYKILVGDFDGDGMADRAFVNKVNHKWYIYSSKDSNNSPLKRTYKKTDVDIMDTAIIKVKQMTHALSGDYDGDGISDLGAIDCSYKGYCQWKYLSSKTGKVDYIKMPGNNEGKWIGMTSNHIVLEGDFDGDGKTDPTIWDAAAGWFIISSRTNDALVDNNIYKLDDLGRPIYKNGVPEKGDTIFGYQWAGIEYIPIVGDFNGDGRSDMAKVKVGDVKWVNGTLTIDKPQSKFFEWYVSVSAIMSQSYLKGGSLLNYFKYKNFGKDYKILVGDYDGDAISDCIMVNPKDAKIYFYTSSFGSKPISKVIYPLYNSSTGALYKVQFVPEPSIDEPKIHSMPKTSPKFSTKDMTLTISDMELGSDVRVYNTIGQNIIKTKADFGEKIIQLPSKGMYIVRVGSHSSVVNIK
jgi:hypothetical protein